jgi:hypothetical protein
MDDRITREQPLVPWIPRLSVSGARDDVPVEMPGVLILTQIRHDAACPVSAKNVSGYISHHAEQFQKDLIVSVGLDER